VKNEKYSAYMLRFIDRIYDTLKNKETWLKKLLDMNDWWVRASCIPFIMGELGWDDHDEIEYYMDINVWEPETRFGETGTPPCPNCKSSKQVVRNGKLVVSACCRVCEFKRDYYIRDSDINAITALSLSTTKTNPSRPATTISPITNQRSAPSFNRSSSPLPPTISNNTDDDDDDEVNGFIES